MRFFVLLLLVVGCSRETAAPRAPSLEQHRALALAVPAGDVELAKAKQACDEAPALADRWVQLGQLWVRKARASNDPGQYLSAEGAAQVALSLQPDFSAALALQALVALNQHRFAEARTLAGEALKRREDDLLALAALADATLELGDVESSTRAVQKMVDLKPNLPSYGRAAHLRWLAGDAKGAQALYRQAIDAGNNPKDPEPQAWMMVQAALVFLDQGDVDGAEAGFQLALSKLKDYPPALVGEARVLLARGAVAQALPLLERAVSQSPLVETWVLLAEAREVALEADGAQAAWAKAEKLGRAADPLALARGWSEASMNLAEAVKLLEAEKALRPNVQVEGALAWAYFKNQQQSGATAASARALAVGSKDVRLMYQAAAIAAANGEKQEALTALKALEPRMLGLSPRLANEARALEGLLEAQLAVR